MRTPVLWRHDVYYGTSSGSYTTPLNAGNTTTATLQNLSAQTYYIAVTAYNSSNVQSAYSPELVVDSLTASAGSGGTISPSGTFSRPRMEAKALPLLLLPATQHKACW